MQFVEYQLHNNKIEYPRIFPWVHSNNFSTQEYQNLVFDPDLSCPSKINPGGGSGGSSSLLSTKNVEQTQYESSLTTLNSTVDGGSTSQMESTVAMTTDQNAWNAYQKLMSEQGYLSDEVLKGVSEKEDGLSKAMVRNVLVANPASAKSAEVQQKLDERLDPLPDYMRYQIDQGLYQLSPREAMERMVSGHRYNRDMAIKQGVRLVLTDTLMSDAEKKTQLIAFYQNTGDKNHELKLALLHDRFGETQQADNVYNQLLDNSNGTAFYNELTEYLALRTLLNSWGSLNGLSNQQLSALSVYSDAGAMASSRARAILALNNATLEPEDMASPEDLGNKSLSGGNNRKWDLSIADNMMLVFPNPTDDFVTLRYAVADAYNQLLLAVYDTKGNAVYSTQLHYDRDEVIVPLENLPAGNYYIQLLKDGKTLKTEKVSLVK